MKIFCQILLFGILVVSSCNKDEIKIDPNNPIIGTWIYSNHNNNAVVFARSEKFINNIGYQFNSDGTLLERNISGWCATPPISFSDYQGRWSMLNETDIQLDVIYFDGLKSYKLNIKSVDPDSLRFTY
jgi:hypothetical protein